MENTKQWIQVFQSRDQVPRRNKHWHFHFKQYFSTSKVICQQTINACFISSMQNTNYDHSEKLPLSSTRIDNVNVFKSYSLHLMSEENTYFNNRVYRTITLTNRWLKSFRRIKVWLYLVYRTNLTELNFSYTQATLYVDVTKKLTAIPIGIKHVFLCI